MIDARALLQRDVRGLGAEVLTYFVTCYFEGLRSLLPRSWAARGWTAEKAMLMPGEDDAILDRLRVEKSWLGERRVAPDSENTTPLPTLLILPRGKYFVTKVSLPRAAAPNLQETIRLRLQDISPIPPSESAFAIGGVNLRADGRINVDVAVTRKRTLDDLRKRFADRQIVGIGAGARTDGALEFQFDRANGPHRLKLSARVRDVALLFGALATLLVSIGVHLSRRLDNAQAREAAVIEALRDARKTAALFDGMSLEAATSERGEPVARALGRLRIALTDLPAGALIENVLYERGRTTISGFAPRSLMPNAAARGEIRSSPSDRPDFDRFDYAVEALPDQGGAP